MTAIVDVSKWDKTIQWDIAHLQGGVEGVITRATLGSDGDAFATWNIRKAEAAGIAERAIYGALIPFNADDTDFQAEALAAAFEGLADHLSGFLLPNGTRVKIVADIERNNGLSTLTMRGRALRYLQRIKALTGETPGVYTAPGIWNGIIGNVSWAKDYPLWVAHYGVVKPTLPIGWTTHWLWQYTDRGQVLGIPAKSVDLNKRP